MVYVIIAIIIALVAIIGKTIIEKKKWEKFWAAEGETVSQQIQSFYAAFNVLKTHYVANREILDFIAKWAPTYNLVKAVKISKKSDFIAALNNFVHDYANISQNIGAWNEQFVKEEKQHFNSLLSNIDSRSLDDQQRTAVVTDEDRMLILAGAGSGKTLTISGKVKYLCETKKAAPDEILLIAYTNKAANEMNERIGKRMSIDVHAVTFHKLGKDIISDYSDAAFDIIDDIGDFLRNYFETVIMKDKYLVKKLIEYYAYYLCIPTDLSDYDSLGEAYEHQKNMDYETIKSKYSKRQYIKKQEHDKKLKRIDLQGEELKSFEEVSIANFLFLNGVKYEYEKSYPIPSDNPEYRMYKPDFYLPDYDIYLEHFGVDENECAPQYSKAEEEKYIESVKWKREWHEKNGTTLIETYSYYSKQGILLEELKRKLFNAGVKFKEPDYLEIFDAIYDGAGDIYFAEFIKLCATFITLLKSSGYTDADIQDLEYKTNKHNNQFDIKRTELFKDIITNVCKNYQRYLDDKNAIDFSDMISKATELIIEHGSKKAYKYIIIDEFQDISIARYKLIKALLDATGAKLFCVGDDWQSIYRFAGSDISIFTQFSNYFGYSKILKIEQTYRNSQELVNAMSSFIQKNPLQLKKDLYANKHLVNPLQFVSYNPKENGYVQSGFNVQLETILKKIISEFGKNSSVLFLGRTKFDIEFLSMSGLFSIKERNGEYHIEYKNCPSLKIQFLSVHRAKGLEADNVILLNFQNKILGFPNKIADDPLLELVLSIDDTFKYAEERRLLYVALTRTRNYSYVLVNEASPSEFLNDFGQNLHQNALVCPRCGTGKLIKRIDEYGNHLLGCTNYPYCGYTIENTDHKPCPKCGGYLIIRKGNHGAFWGCSNYPRCSYTEEITMQKKCPKCGNRMTVKTSYYGIFWGCSNYPNCKYTENIRSTRKTIK